MISGDEARNMEPRLSSEIIAAMHAPTTGIVSPFKLVLHTALNSAANGARFQFNTKVEHIEAAGEGYALHTNRGVIHADYIVNTSGEGAAELERFVRGRDLVIKPKRGEYLVFDCPSPIKHVIYQAQEHDEKGTLLAPTVDGNMLAGPTSYKAKSYKCTETTQKESIISPMLRKNFCLTWTWAASSRPLQEFGQILKMYPKKRRILSCASAGGVLSALWALKIRA